MSAPKKRPAPTQEAPDGDLDAFTVEGHTHWTFTLGSKETSIHEESPQDYVEHLKENGCVAARIGVEFGKKKEYPHWQCAAVFLVPTTFNQVRDIVAWHGYIGGKLKYHEPKSKKWWNAYNYCKKDSRHVDFNEQKVSDKSSKDVAIEVNTMITSGCSLEEVNKAHPVYVMYNLDKLMKYEAWLAGKYKRCRFDEEY